MRLMLRRTLVRRRTTTALPPRAADFATSSQPMILGRRALVPTQASSPLLSLPFFRRTFASTSSSPKPKSTPVSWASLAICVVVGTGLVSYYTMEKERRQTETASNSQTKTIGKAAIGGPWSLFNTAGHLVTDMDYRGTFQFVYFGFTRCPDICPNELVKIGKIFETLESNPNISGQIKPLFISIDPRRDTIDQLKEYAQDFHPAFDWLTGTPEQVNAVAKAYRVYWSKVDVTTDEDDDDEYSVDHTIVTYLMGPDGEFVDLFTSGVDSKQVIERITKHVEEWG